MVYRASIRLGQFYCLEPETGQILWTSAGREGRLGYLVRAADRLLLTTSDGTVRVARADAGGYDEIARYKLAEESLWSQPAWIGDRFLTRANGQLRLWQVGG